MDRILLGQLGANGDCLYATILARQLREDHPRAHFTWGIASQCAGLLRNNPDVDEGWEVPVCGWDDDGTAMRVFERVARMRYQPRVVDLVILSQILARQFVSC